MRSFQGSDQTATGSRATGPFHRNALALAVVALFALFTISAAQAQIVFNGPATGGSVSGGIDVNGDGVYTDGSWNATMSPTATANTINYINNGISTVLQGGPSYTGTYAVNFSITDPSVVYRVVVTGNTGMNQSFEQKYSGHTITWSGGGTATIADPSSQLSSVSSSAGSVSFVQNQATLADGSCAYFPPTNMAWRNYCVAWTVTLPTGVTGVSVSATGGQAAEGMSFRLVSQADLIISKSVSASTIAEGGSGTFTITAANANIVGNSAATGVHLTDLLPSGVTFTGYTVTSTGLNSGGTYNSATGLWDIGKIARGETISLTINFTVNAGQAGNTIVNAINPATITMAQSDPTNNNGSLSAQFFVPAVKPVADSGTGVSGVASTPIANVRSNDTINGAAATSSNSTIAQSGTWPPGFSLNTTTGAVSIAASVSAGTYTFDYALCNLTPICVTVTDTVVVSSSVDFAIKKTNTPGVNGGNDQASDTLAGGSNTTYTVVVTNNGPSAVTGGIVKDTPVSGLTCATTNPVTITGQGVPSGSFTVAELTGSGIVLGTLAAGQSTTLTYSCLVN